MHLVPSIAELGRALVCWFASTIMSPGKPAGIIGGNSTGISLLIILALYFPATDACADTRIESDTFAAQIDMETLESKIDNKGLLEIKLQKPVQAGPATRFQFVATNTTNSTVQLSPVHIYTGTSLSRLEDVGGGFGASLYSYLDPFIGGESVDRISGLGESSTVHDWFGWVNRYYFEAIRFAGDNRYALTHRGDEDLSPRNLSVKIDGRELAPGDVFTFQFDYQSAPKTRQLLGEPEINLEGLLLDGLWDWLRSLCFLLWNLVDYLRELLGGWGQAIIMLALIIRIMTIPVTRYSLGHQEVSIEQQSRIGPLLQEVKQNYTGAEQSEKIIELYEQQNYQHLAPFKSMSGLFIQIPIFIALFNVLGAAFEVSGQSFLWIGDLALSDRLFSWGVDIPYFGTYFNLLPLIMAAITIVSTWLASKHSGNRDATTTTLFGMGLVFLILFYSFPAALVLYWLSSNLFQLIQQTMENWVKRGAE